MDRRVAVVIQRLRAQALPATGSTPAKSQRIITPTQISLDALAASVNLSASRLRVLFKTETELTIQQYVKRMKMQRAQELVRDTFLRVSEISTQLDWKDSSHFVRDYKRNFGVTPGEYRRSLNLAKENQTSW